LKLSFEQWNPAESSSMATLVKALTLEPRKTPSTVSNSLPSVLKVAMPLAGAHQVSQTELGAGERPASFGSPGSSVAPQLVPRPKPEAV